MAMCEDWPCCGHTAGDPCPERDKQGDIVGRCVECGGRLKKGFRSSICAGCQRSMARRDREGDIDFDHSMQPVWDRRSVNMTFAAFAKVQGIDLEEMRHQRMMADPERVLQGARGFLSRTWRRDGWQGLSTGPAISILGRASAAISSAAKLGTRRRAKFDGDGQGVRS